MGVSCIKLYYSKAFWVLWVLRKTWWTFPAGNQNSALLGALPQLSSEASRNPGEKALD